MTRLQGIAAATITLALSLLVFAAFWLPSGWPFSAPTSTPIVSEIQIDQPGSLDQTDAVAAAVTQPGGPGTTSPDAAVSGGGVSRPVANVTVGGPAVAANGSLVDPLAEDHATVSSAAPDAAGVAPSTSTAGDTTAVVPAAASTQGLRLRIPSLGVDALVIELGFNAQGQLEVPSDAYTVGWYSISAAPGSSGNALFGGHLNWRGSLGVFGRLTELNDGDLIYLVQNGQELAYEVSRTGYVEADAPLQAVLQAPALGSTLTLFTCGGTFDRSVREYDHRFVVNAIRVANGAG